MTEPVAPPPARADDDVPLRNVRARLQRNNTQSAPRCFHGGCILTCDPCHVGPAEPVLHNYNWMFVESGLVKALGSGSPPVLQGAEYIDLRGRLVLPGLFDAHCHVFAQGKMQQSLILQGTQSIKDLQEKLCRHHAQHPDLQVIEGNQWDDELLGRLPTKEDLDVVSVPVVLYRRCWHICCVNSAALTLCNIQGGEKVAGGEVDVDAHGRATGILREGAMDELLSALKSAGSVDQHKQFLQQGMEVFLRRGCTSLLTNDSEQIGGLRQSWKRYLEMEETGKLPLRIFLTVAWKDVDHPSIEQHIVKSAESSPCPPWHNEAQSEMQLPPSSSITSGEVPRPFASGRFAVFRVKLWTDGALGASTAALDEPYADDPSKSNKGILQLEPQLIRKAIRLASTVGFGVEAHTIGDRSARELLDAFEEHQVQSRNRYTMTHCQILSSALIQRMASQGVIASIQPQFSASDASIAPLRIGQGSERLRHSYAWRTLRQAGVRLAGGSDAPVEVPDPLEGIYCAMVNDVHDSESLSFAAALEMYTLGGAYAAFREGDLGALKEGYQADFVITSLLGGLSAAEKPEEFRKAKVEEVWVGGKQEYFAMESGLEPAIPAKDGPGKRGLVFAVRGPCPCCARKPGAT
eukprot:TRINITY_DN62133_c0_g1_i1.p1 TRINITY_DN62133_c0_g1~~TRINITY_DN62133_c0_g1_i1.p1  ORF type:complete len:644 (+),score=99.55 TRINITY_DN62133_c0_g1_i1:32-1933(+)